MGEDTEDIPDSYVIFITENDVMKGNKPLYPVERYVTIGEEKVLFNAGSHILYVNGKYRGDDEIGKLMHDFSCINPDDMNYDALAKRARYFKQCQSCPRSVREFRYDTQLLIEGENLDEDAISEYFAANFKGDSLLAVMEWSRGNKVPPLH